MTIRGIRQTIPGGTILGNMGSSNGPAQAIRFHVIAPAIFSAPGGSSPTVITGDAANIALATTMFSARQPGSGLFQADSQAVIAQQVFGG
jgi:hypothetical protein